MSTSLPPGCPFRLPGAPRCPSAAELRAYAEHTLPPMAAMALFDQLERCPDCRLVVEEHLHAPAAAPPDLDEALGQAALAVLIEAPDGLSAEAQRFARDILGGSFGGQWQLAPDERAGLAVLPVGTGLFAGAAPPVNPRTLRLALQILASAAPFRGLRVFAAAAGGKATPESAAVDRAIDGARQAGVSAGIWADEATAALLPAGQPAASLGAPQRGWRLVPATEGLPDEADPRLDAPAPPRIQPDAHRGEAAPARGEAALPRLPGLVPGLLVAAVLLAFLALFAWLSRAPEPSAPPAPAVEAP